jgi:N-acetylglucosaminyl-diphospho-decaprenol L-rhamnosyltransferase
MNGPRTGIVIVTYECRDLALVCLDSLAKHVPELLPDTVIVDNASRDGIAEAVESHWPMVRLLRRASNDGFSAGVNDGLGELVEKDVICLLNPDAVVKDSGILAAAEFLDSRPDAGVLGARIVNHDGTVQASARRFPGFRTAFFNRHSLATRFLPGNRFSRNYLMSEWAHDDAREVDWVSGAFMFIHRRAIEAVGVLDSGYFFGIEDVDYCRRVRDAGLAVMYFPGAAAQHRIGGSSRKAVYRAMAGHHRGMWLYYRKHLRGSIAVDAVTLAGISARFALHATSYALRTAKNRVLRRPNP